MTDEEAVLWANERFYRAFAEGNVPAMESVWSTQDRITCIHPGWPVVAGYTDVMGSWRTILEQSPLVRIEGTEAILLGETALVVCTEIIGNDHLAATNIFLREEGSWLLIHHHSSPVQVDNAQGTNPRTGSLH